MKTVARTMGICVAVVLLTLLSFALSACATSGAFEKPAATKTAPEAEADAARAVSPPAEVSHEEAVPSPVTTPDMGIRGDSSPADALAWSAEPKKDKAAAGAASPAPMTPPPSAGAVMPAKPVPGASGLKAGFSDDNAQFNYFVKFLKDYTSTPHFDLPIDERITITVVDSAAKPVSGAKITVLSGSAKMEEGLTYANGAFRIYPLAYGSKAKDSFEVRVQSGTSSKMVTVKRDGPRTITVALDGKRTIKEPIPVDLLFIMDTTGSMGEEIERLRSTIEIIYANISALKPKPIVRLGLVLYKDVEDIYRTKVVHFTSNLDSFQKALDEIDADGGGDTPEDLQAALADAVKTLSWTPDGVKLSFIVTDAGPHLDYSDQLYTYVEAAKEAKSKAIKFFTIGTGGLPLEGEYVLRQISQYTDAKYIFLTYGEGGEAGGGREGSVSHHTGTNFSTDKLETVIMRFVKEEIAWLSDTPLVVEDDYFNANKLADEERDITLSNLFDQALRNLVDYSTFKLGIDTPCAIMPISVSDPGMANQAEYFSERIMLSASAGKLFKVVERKDLQKLLAEMELQLSGLVDESKAAKVGEMLGAEVMVTGTMYRKDDRYEIFLKLLRVSTAEVLAVAKAKIDVKLGL